jgi:hypothetical protein
MKFLFVRQRVWRIIAGTGKAPAGPSDEAPQLIPGRSAVETNTDYDQRYHDAFRFMFESLDDKHRTKYMSIEDPSELWRAIRKDYVKERLIKTQLCVKGRVVR